MKQLFLLRHAKSSWDDPGLEDLRRPLNKRGRRAAQRMADYFRRAQISPDLVLCSPSLRTRQTWDALAAAIGDHPVSFDARIYEASPRALLARLEDLPSSAASVLLIGHNPGLEQLVFLLTSNDEEQNPLLEQLGEKYPTGTLAVLSAPILDWGSLPSCRCHLDAFVRPVDLETGGLP